MNAKEMRAKIARLQKELPKQEERERVEKLEQEERERVEKLPSVSVTIGAEGKTNRNRYSVRVNLNGHNDRCKVCYGTRAKCEAHVRRMEANVRLMLAACEKCLKRCGMEAYVRRMEAYARRMLAACEKCLKRCGA